MHRSILGPNSTEEFVRLYWRKEACFLPNAVQEFSSPLTPDELAGLACEEHIESRIVTETSDVDREGRRVKRPYRLLHGPFSEEQFSDLGEEAWTLLVQDVDKLVPKVHALLDLVSFLPRWSVDDIMISYAVPGGSVGPHTDRYDVFLLQAQGTRRWQISRKVDDTRLRDDTDLRVLAEFEPEEEFIARPGDVLYLPPGVAHYGVAEDECMTFSFGFRAPTEAALVSHFADEMAATAGELQLVERQDRPLAGPARLSPEVLARARQMVRARFDALMLSERSIGRYLTMPKPHLVPESPEENVSTEALADRLGAGARLTRNIASRFLYAEEEEGVILFVDGQDYSLGSGERAKTLAVRLCEGAPLDASEPLLGAANPHLDGGRTWELVLLLVNSGALVTC